MWRPCERSSLYTVVHLNSKITWYLVPGTLYIMQDAGRATEVRITPVLRLYYSGRNVRNMVSNPSVDWGITDNTRGRGYIVSGELSKHKKRTRALSAGSSG